MTRERDRKRIAHLEEQVRILNLLCTELVQVIVADPLSLRESEQRRMMLLLASDLQLLDRHGSDDDTMLPAHIQYGDPDDPTDPWPDGQMGPTRLTEEIACERFYTVRAAEYMEIPDE